jgi:predicted nucleic acid-binding protein
MSAALLPIILDTSGLISLASLTDSNHGPAVAIARALLAEQRSVVVPGEVLTETLNVVGKRQGHQAALKVGRTILDTPAYVLAETTTTIREHSLQRFATLPQSVSYTDCLVMAFADHYQTKLIFGFDAAFRKQGYRLPKSAPRPDPTKNAAWQEQRSPA